MIAYQFWFIFDKGNRTQYLWIAGCDRMKAIQVFKKYCDKYNIYDSGRLPSNSAIITKNVTKITLIGDEGIYEYL